MAVNSDSILGQTTRITSKHLHCPCWYQNVGVRVISISEAHVYHWIYLNATATTPGC